MLVTLKCTHVRINNLERIQDMTHKKYKKMSREAILRTQVTRAHNYKARVIKERGNIEQLKRGTIHWEDTKIIRRNKILQNYTPVKCVCGTKRLMRMVTILNRLTHNRKCQLTGGCPKCCGKRRSGANNNAWIGGRRTEASGYIQLRADRTDTIAMAMVNNGYVLEHRLVVAHSIGRPLTRAEHVHHLNFNKTDNRLENLMLVSAQEHGQLSYYLELRRQIKKLKTICRIHKVPLPKDIHF